MRALLVLLAAGALSACAPDAEAPPPTVAAAISFDGAVTDDRMATLRHGERLTYVLGCRGCHAKDLRGQLWDDNPREYGVTWAPNLTRSAEAMSAAQLADVIMHGKHPSRAQLWSMPSEMYQHLADSDRDAVIAYLRSLPPSGSASPAPQLGPKAREEIASGLIKPADVMVRELRAVLPADRGPAHALGRYVATVACTECHGHRLEGQRSEEGATPDLTVAASYSREEFQALTTLGTGSGGRTIHPLMQSVGQRRLSRLTQHERDALYDYLTARAARPQ